MYNFGEKDTEYYKGKNLEVWKSPKYEASKKKIIEILDSKKYNLDESDFWILMNSTKTDKMAYTGLIISHNGCLKINDTLEENQKFRPSCVSIDKDGYKGSLVFTYCCDEQGIYEVGEVSPTNCMNAYPYAMAFKRCFDRVVLKISKLAYYGVYSDSEADEFKEVPEAKAEQIKEDNKKIAANDLPIGKDEAEYIEKLIREIDAEAPYEERVEKLLKTYGKSSIDDLLKSEYEHLLNKLLKAKK